MDFLTGLISVLLVFAAGVWAQANFDVQAKAISIWPRIVSAWKRWQAWRRGD